MTDTFTTPKIKRRKKGGIEVGPYRVTLESGERVDLGTEDYAVARSRASEAMRGVREWTSPPAPTADPPSAGIDDWSIDLGNAAASVDVPPPLGETGDYIPPTDKPAAEETAEAEPPIATKLSPEFFNGILDQLAVMLVELQLQGHEWIAARFAKVQLGPVPTEGPASVARTAGAEMWRAALKEWIPETVPLPPYILAPMLIAASALPVQLASATVIKDDEPTPQ